MGRKDFFKLKDFIWIWIKVEGKIDFECKIRVKFVLLKIMWVWCVNYKIGVY